MTVAAGLLPTLVLEKGLSMGSRLETIDNV